MTALLFSSTAIACLCFLVWVRRRKAARARNACTVERGGKPCPADGQFRDRRTGKPRSRRIAPTVGVQSCYQLDAHKTITAFDFILKSFGQEPPWQNIRRFDMYVHDLTVMLEEGDLRSSSLELIGSNRTILYRHRVSYGGPVAHRNVDAAGGIELPLLPPGRIARYRILVAPASRLAEYRKRLRCTWHSADPLVECAGTRFDSEHTRHINRNRMTGDVFVTNEARRFGTIVKVSSAGDYAFARDAGLPVDVYLHQAACERAMIFMPGMQVSYVPIQTPRGFQGRNIRATR